MAADRRARRHYSNPVEALEPRQLLSLTINVRAADGSTSATVNAAGQVLNLQIWATVSGQNANPAQDGLADVIGSFLATNVGFSPVAGNLTAANLSPFDANGSAPGTSQDLNGDGNNDVGSNNTGGVTGLFDARAGSMQGQPPGVVSTDGHSLEFEIGTLNYTVTHLNQGGEVDIAFRVQSISNSVVAVWQEDNTPRNETTGTFTAGTPFKVTAPNVQPVGPVAQDDSFSVTSEHPATLAVLANDVDYTAALDPTTVTILGQPNHGGSAVANPVTGEVAYTSAVGFIGSETFSYIVRDALGNTSTPATVTVTDSRAEIPAPVAANDTATTVLGTPVSIDVQANDTATAPASLDGATVTPTLPNNGTVSVDADSSILYTPNANFVGNDSFTYTISDTNGKTSNTATVNVAVGIDLTSVLGGHRSVTYTDVDGTAATLTLSRGTAILQLGNGTVTVLRGGAVKVAGANLSLSDVSLTGTSLNSVLSIRAAGGDGALALGNVKAVDGAALGVLSARNANLTGNINVGGANVILLNNVVDGTSIALGPAGSPAMLLGNVGSDALTSAVGIRLLSVKSWTSAGNASVITAPALATLVSTHDFDASLALHGGAGKLGVARIGGSLAGGAWSIDGNTSAIVAGSIAPAWSGNFAGAINTFSVRSGGLSASLTAGAIGTLNITGDLSGTIQAASLRVARISGAITNATITSAGDILALVAGSMNNANISAGLPAGITFASAAPEADLGSATIRTVALTSRSANAFSNSTLIARTITTAVLGDVNTASAIPTGLAAGTFSSIAFTAGGKPLHLGARQLATASDVQQYLASTGVNFGNFQIKLL